MICKACGQPIEGRPLLVLEGLAGVPAYFHGVDCWNRYKAKPVEDYKPDAFIPDIIRRRT